MISSIRGLTALAIVALLIPTLSKGMVTVESSSDVESFTLYFLNGIVVYDSLINDTLILETPINISLKDGFEQKVVYTMQYNVVFNETIGAYVFNATKGFIGFFLSHVELHSRHREQTYRSLMQALYDPKFTSTSRSIEMPEEVSSYLKSPYLKVVEVVRPKYEEWFKGTYGYDVEDAGLLGIAATAAYFVQHVFIQYDPSGIPKSIDEVVDTRRGDCDDMSRVLVELLSTYNIPAVISIGYVYVSNFNFTVPIENVTYRYVNCGPHAFVMAYIPSEGWLSLDFLAFTLLAHPFICEGYSRETTVEEELVQEYLSLHRSLNATQVMMILSEEDLLKLLGGPLTLESVMKCLQDIVKIDGITPLDSLKEANSEHRDKEEAGKVDVIMPGVEYIVIVVITLLSLTLTIMFSKRSSRSAKASTQS
ncbi:MAG: transglutaminase family protein [Candidatus Nezhaarchaeales archaeon]